MGCVFGDIEVSSHNVAVFVTGVPLLEFVHAGKLSLVGSLHCPHPDEVVEFVFVGEHIVHISPELLAGFGAVIAPPEPGSPAIVSRRLVQRSEEHGNACVAEQGEVACDLGELLFHLGILPGAFGKGVFHSEGLGVVGVIVDVGGALCRRYAPVPSDLDYVVSFPGLLDRGNV